MQLSRLDTRSLAILAFIICAAVLGFQCGRYFLSDVDDVDAKGGRAALVSEFGAGVPVAQSFSLLRDGLHSMTVSISSDQPAVIGFEFALIRKGVIADWPDEPIARRTVQMSVAPGITKETIDFEPVSRSKNRTFVATFTLTDVMRRGSSASDPKVALSAWADDAFRGGAMKVGATDRWGDLAFKAQVNPPTRLARFSDALDAALDLRAGRTGYVALGALYACLLAIVCVVAFKAWGRDGWKDAVDNLVRVEAPQSATRRSIRVGGAILLAAATPLLFAAILITRERVAVSLLDQLDSARMESPAGMHTGFSRIEEVINGASPAALFAHPPSRVAWTVAVPSQQPWFRTTVALRPYVWEGHSDGVSFEVSVSDGTNEITQTRFLNPGQQMGDRAWVEMAIDLSAYAGRSVTISLATSPGPRGDVAWDWAMWGNPRIVSLQWFERYGRAMRDLNRERSGD